MMPTPEAQLAGQLPELAVPYPALFAEYQNQVNAQMNEIIMLRAAVAHLRGLAAPAPSVAQPEEKENGS